ncbi:DJ-1/PfpI family protein [Maribacter sp.]|nr:DJ-1/PfpI family protein [Maribacter sp.]
MLFIVPPKVHLLDLNGPSHVFYEAKEQGADIALYFVSIDDVDEIASSAGLYFSRLQHFNQFDLTAADFIFVPGIDYQLLSDKNFLKKNAPFFEWLRKQNSNGTSICSVCTGAFLLAEAGILDYKRSTTHWKYLELFKRNYPLVDLLNKRLFVFDENVYTSAGVSSGIDLSLFILENLYGTKFATDIAKEVVIYFRRGESDPQLSIYLEYRNHMEYRIHRAQDFLIKNMHQFFTLVDVSEEIHMSSRNLTRLFKKTTGITIGAYIEKLRVERAVHLLSEHHKVDFVAGQCGLKSTNQLRTLLKKHLDMLPSGASYL